MDLVAKLGLGEDEDSLNAEKRDKRLGRVRLRLVADGLMPATNGAAEVQEIAGGLLQS